MKYIHGAGGSSPKPQKQKAAPKPIIEQDDAALKSISYAKFQFLLCEGEIEGPAAGNSIADLERSVYLEGTPIRARAAVLQARNRKIWHLVGAGATRPVRCPGLQPHQRRSPSTRLSRKVRRSLRTSLVLLSAVSITATFC